MRGPAIWEHSMPNRLASLLSLFLLGSVAAGCASDDDSCERAAAHLEECFGPGAAATAECTEDYAEGVLAKSCEQLQTEKADGLTDFLCEAFGILCPAVTCDHNGASFDVGDSRPDDECPGNNCTCNDFDGEGVWACTELACAPACTHGGESYFVGDSRPDDECPGNNCTCNVFGGQPSWSCTELACAPVCLHDGDFFDVGDSRPDEECPGNTCTCNDFGDAAPSWSCTELACAPVCVHDGDFFDIDDTRPGDDCDANVCTCVDTGSFVPSWSCTELGCPQ